MQQRDTLDSLRHTVEQATASSLVAKLNQVIADHYPPGEVHYQEVIWACKSLAYSYTRVLINPELRDTDIWNGH